MKPSPRNNSRIVSQELSLIESLIQRKEFKRALAELRDLENQKELGKFSYESGEFYYLFALALQGVGNYEEALSKAKESFDILRNSSENEKLAKVQFISGIIYSDLGNLTKSESELRDALAIYRRIKNEKGIIESYNELARIHFIKTEYDKAIEYLKEGLSFCKRMSDNKRIARFSGNLGRIYLRIGKWEEAKKNLLLSLESNTLNNNLINVCCCYLSLGYLSYLLRDFSQANKYLEKALKLIFENNYTREFAIYSEYSGELEFAQGNYEKAKNHYWDCISRMEEIAPESDMISQTYRLLAELQIAEKQYDEALSSCEKALRVAESLGEKIEIGSIHRALGQIYTAKHEKGKAKENFEKSISILEQIGAKFELGKSYLEATKSNAFEYFDRVAHFGNARETFKELESDYYIGKAAFAFCELLFENGEYEKAEVYLKDPEKIFKRLNEKRELDLVGELKSRINKALNRVGSFQVQDTPEYHFSDIVTQDPQMLALIEEARKFKDLDVPILLEGETGTGKDILAKAIHCESKRREKRLVKVNCAAIPETLLESELFGYKRGAFTGADKDKKGLFEEADGGTIFLNEIRDLPIRLQAKILDVIEDKEVTRLGEVKPRRANFRVIASTNKNLAEEVSKGNFRKDLYHRVNVVELRLPPLRERRKDIPLLIKHFLANSNIQIDSQDLDFQPFLEYHWPGNVRELENEFRKYTSISELMEGLKKWDKTGDKVISGKLMQMEKSEILEAIRTTEDKKEAAKLLGISLATLYRKIKLYDLEV
jgi:two-component system NtrC family response regulator